VVRACQLEARVKACANEDGYLTADGPILIYEGAKLPVQPLMFLQAFVTPPSDEQLASGRVHQTAYSRERCTQDCRTQPGPLARICLPTDVRYGPRQFRRSRALRRTVSPSFSSGLFLRALQLVRSYIRAFFGSIPIQPSSVMCTVSATRCRSG